MLFQYIPFPPLDSRKVHTSKDRQFFGATLEKICGGFVEKCNQPAIKRRLMGMYFLVRWRFILSAIDGDVTFAGGVV